MTIGDWVQRERKGVAHYVESVVSGDMVTRCGKRMRDEPNRNGGLKQAGLIDATFNRCQRCDR